MGEAFQNARHWIGEIDKYGKEDVNKLLLGNKCDLTSKRVVMFDDGKELADSLNMRFIETSAKNSHNVELAFDTLASEIKARMQSQPADPNATHQGMRLRPTVGDL